MPRTVLGANDLVKRLKVAEQELERQRPAPRVELDLEAVLSLVQLSRQCIEDLLKVQ